MRRRVALAGALAYFIPRHGRATDKNPGLENVLSVTGLFAVMDPFRLLQSSTYRIETLTALDETLFETSGEYDFERYVMPSSDDRLIHVPKMKIRVDGSVRLLVKQGTSVFEAVCGMGPIVNGKVFFRIDPVSRMKEETFVQQDGKRRITSRTYVHHLWDIRIAPRPGVPAGSF